MNFGDALTAISRRFSHVGRRPALFEPALVNISIKPKPRSISRVFQQTPVVQKIVASGPLGVLSYPIHHGLTCQVVDGHVPTEKKLVVDLDKDAFDKMSKYKQKFVKSMWGTTASGLNRMIEGVSEGFQVSLRLVGVGYKAAMDPTGKQLVLKLGYSHDVILPLPPGITGSCPSQTKILLNGIDYQKLTQFASIVRSKRKPEPYNGKGIFVGEETITLKEGKKK